MAPPIARRVHEAPTMGVMKQKRPATRLNRLMWKSLPPELLYFIVEETAGLRNLKAWCAATATSDSVGLHSFALRRYHQRFVVSRQNLVSEQTVCTRRTLASVHVDTQEITRTLLPPSSNHKLPPLGHSIECLVLNFQTGFTSGSMTMADIRKFEFSMDYLLPRLEYCKEVDQYGDLLPTLFEDIVRKIGTTVERLSLRKLNSHAPPRLLGRFKDPNKWPTVSMDLPFERLMRRKNITSLEVGNLRYQEVRNLVVAIRTLQNLRNLHIEANPGSNAVTCRFLTGMFRIYERTHLPLGFPTALRRLTIIDDDDEWVYRRSRGRSKLTLSSTCDYDLANEDILSADVIVAKLEDLEYMYLDLGCARLSLALFKRIKPDQLRHLSIALMRFALLEDADYSIWSVIENELPNLQQLEILNVWKFANFLHSLRTADSSCFVNPQQVFLAEPPPPAIFPSNRTRRERNPKARYDSYMNTSILCHDYWQHRWGTRVEYLRMDHCDFGRMTVNGIRDPSAGLQNLKVVIVDGGPRYPDDDSAWTLDPDWNPRGILGRPIPTDGIFPEFEVVKQIAGQDLDCLRVVVANGYHFWVRVRTPPYFPKTLAYIMTVLASARLSES